MQRHTTLAFVILLFTSTHLAAAEQRSDEFIRDAIEGNLFEIKAGELAQSKGERPTVREFGAMLAKDHANARSKSEQAAKAIGAKFPTTPSETQRALLANCITVATDTSCHAGERSQTRFRSEV